MKHSDEETRGPLDVRETGTPRQTEAQPQDSVASDTSHDPQDETDDQIRAELRELYGDIEGIMFGAVYHGEGVSSSQRWRRLWRRCMAAERVTEIRHQIGGERFEALVRPISTEWDRRWSDLKRYRAAFDEWTMKGDGDLEKGARVIIRAMLDEGVEWHKVLSHAAQVLNHADNPYPIATGGDDPTAIELAAKLVGEVLHERFLENKPTVSE
jgi:hypothetical protein